MGRSIDSEISNGGKFFFVRKNFLLSWANGGTDVSLLLSYEKNETESAKAHNQKYLISKSTNVMQGINDPGHIFFCFQIAMRAEPNIFLLPPEGERIVYTPHYLSRVRDSKKLKEFNSVLCTSFYFENAALEYLKFLTQ